MEMQKRGESKEEKRNKKDVGTSEPVLEGKAEGTQQLNRELLMSRLLKLLLTQKYYQNILENFTKTKPLS